MTASPASPAAAYLAEVKGLVAHRDEVIAQAKGTSIEVRAFNAMQDRLAERVPVLAAALEAVLALTEPRDKIDRDLDGNPEQPLIRLVRCDEIRDAIEAALTGAQGGAG